MKELVPHILAEEVKESGLSQKWLAKRMKISHIALNYYLVGRRPMPSHVEWKLIKALEHIQKMDLT